MIKIIINGKTYYQDDEDKRCSTCAFVHASMELCMMGAVKCLAVSNRGGDGNWKLLKT